MVGEGPCYGIIWAPWRMKYIEEDAGKKDEASCVFCEAPRKDDREALILYRGRYSYIILNRYPYNTAHTMVVPYRHVPSLEDLTREELSEMIIAVKAVLEATRREYKPHGFNVGVNIGEAAGAGIAGHVHIHVVPRWCGDANFTFTVGGVKVLPETLDRTYERLKPVVEEACKNKCRPGQE